jgi:hypothetical protein
VTTMFRRRAVVYVDTLKVEGLDLAFKISKTVKKEPNTCDLQIFNLAERTRSAMRAKGAKVIVQAGYGQTVRQIFSGDARTIDHKRTGPDWITHAQCGDGERAYADTRVSESFAAGTPVAEVLKTVAGTLPVSMGAALSTLAGVPGQFTQGYTAHGNAAAELDTLLAARGYEWSVQDGELRVLKIDQPAPGAVIVISPSSGMIGSPEHGAPDKKHKPSILKVRSLLNGAILPGGRIRVQAAGISGDFRVQKVEHTGTTFGQEFYTDVEALPIGG